MILKKGMRVKDKRTEEPFIVLLFRGKKVLYSTLLKRIVMAPTTPSDHLDFDYAAHDAGDKGRRHAMNYSMDKYAMKNFSPKLNKNQGENTMNINGTVAKVYKDIDEIVLVTKHLGREYREGSHKDYLILKQHKAAVLKEAQRLESKDG